MLSRRAMTGLVLVATLFCGALAAGGAANAQRVNFCGAVRFVPRNCILVPGGVAGTGREWDITGVRPTPRRGATIAGSGTERGMSLCIRADRRLANVTWRRVSFCPARRR